MKRGIVSSIPVPLSGPASQLGKPKPGRWLHVTKNVALEAIPAASA